MTNIRTYIPADHTACIDMFKSNCPGYFDPSELQLLERWLGARDAGKILHPASDGDFFYVLEHESKLVGCGGFYVTKGEQKASMVWGMVHKNYHKQGFGKQLFLFRLNELERSFPSHSVVLDTSQHTFGFFEKLGFYVTSIKPNGYGPGLDRYDMLR